MHPTTLTSMTSNSKSPERCAGAGKNFFQRAHHDLVIFRSLTSNKLCQTWFPSSSKLSNTYSVNQLQRLQIDSCVRASTSRDQTCFVPFSQAILEGLFRCSRPGRTSSLVPTSTSRPYSNATAATLNTSSLNSPGKAPLRVFMAPR